MEILLLILTTIMFGVAANNTDRVLLNIFRKYLNKAGTVVHYELKKTLKRSFLAALQNIVLDCYKELYPHKFLGVFPVYPPEHKADLKWLDQKRNQFARELKQLERENFVNTSFASVDEIESLLNTTDILTNENIQIVKGKLIAEALKDDIVPECYERKVRADLFEPVRNHFTQEINHNPVVHNLFHTQLLANKINEQNSTIQKLVNNVLYASKKTAVTVNLDVDVSGLCTPQLLAIIEELQQQGKDVTLKIRRIEAGSVKLVLEGTQKGIKRIEELFKTGQLTEVSGIPIKEVHVELPLLPSEQSSLVKLAQWLQNNFVEAIKMGWLGLDMIPTNVAFPVVRTTEIKRAKQVNLGMEHTVVLVIDIRQLNNQEIEVSLWLCATDEQTTLPKELKFTLFDKSSGIVREKIANGKDKFLPIKWSFNVGEQFCITIQLDNINVTENFVL
ncbi:DUF1822 family protein [Candidatus Parabeggiatoa sp. HSG14]|uniref:DUF1822 family protein n=1 Tax=Candidatus Parabeggiatoa sp. HSG14 TaxID=3055593 RepID=UPI0025A7FD29|nr:DUF1822 family protein [Thiotrichales bacterium HSG14]